VLTITNATKAQAIAAVNAILGLLATFNLGHLTPGQSGAVLVAVNAVLSLIVGVTYKLSKTRVPDPPPAPPAA